MSAVGIFYGTLRASANTSAAGTPAAARRAFGQQMETFGQQFSLLLPLPHGIDTVAGYIQWRVYGALPLLFGFWALMSASGSTRGDEQAGLVEQWLTSPIDRSRYLGTRFAAFTVAAVLALVATSIMIVIGAA